MIKDNYKRIYSYLVLLLSLFVSLKLGENSSGGSKQDYYFTLQYILAFQESFTQGILLFLKNGELHFPYFYFFIALLNNFFGTSIVNYIYIFLSSFIPLVFYKILKIRFKKIKKNKLFIVSILIFFSPYFRSSAVWITTDNIALLFFLLSVLFFWKTIYENVTFKLFYSFLTILFIILASYSRHNYSIFWIIFMITFYKQLNVKLFIYLIFISFLFSLPALFYIYDFINYQQNIRLYSDVTEENYFFNFILINSFLFFYLTPFIINKNFFEMFKNKFKLIVLFTVGYIFLLVFIEHVTLPYGGGIFYKLSLYLDNVNILYIFSLLGMVYFITIVNFKNINYILFILLIFSYPVLIFQKYFDPLLIIVFFTLISSDFIKNNIANFNMKLVYTYFISFLVFSNWYYFFIA